MNDIYKEKYHELLGAAGPIHWSTKFGKNCRVGAYVVIEEGCEFGDNCIIGHGVVMRPGVKMGDRCAVGHLCSFEGDAKVGNHVTIHCNSHITSTIIIEDDVFIGPGVDTGNTRHIVHGRSQELILKGPHIHRAARIGLGSNLAPGVVIGENAEIGVGSTVIKDVPPRETWVGDPAKFLRMVPTEELIIY
jgi:acetyltransferase-like isoleucine patch superfamily enzyme